MLLSQQKARTADKRQRPILPNTEETSLFNKQLLQRISQNFADKLTHQLSVRARQSSALMYLQFSDHCRENLTEIISQTSGQIYFYSEETIFFCAMFWKSSLPKLSLNASSWRSLLHNSDLSGNQSEFFFSLRTNLPCNKFK